MIRYLWVETLIYPELPLLGGGDLSRGVQSYLVSVCTGEGFPNRESQIGGNGV